VTRKLMVSLCVFSVPSPGGRLLSVLSLRASQQFPSAGSPQPPANTHSILWYGTADACTVDAQCCSLTSCSLDPSVRGFRGVQPVAIPTAARGKECAGCGWADNQLHTGASVGAGSARAAQIGRRIPPPKVLSMFASRRTVSFTRSPVALTVLRCGRRVFASTSVQTVLCWHSSSSTHIRKKQTRWGPLGCMHAGLHAPLHATRLVPMLKRCARATSWIVAAAAQAHHQQQGYGPHARSGRAG
jgi:hypothetical protein